MRSLCWTYQQGFKHDVLNTLASHSSWFAAHPYWDTRLVWEAQDVGNWKPFPNVTAILQKLSAPLLSKAEAYSSPHVKHFGQLPAAPLTEA